MSEVAPEAEAAPEEVQAEDAAPEDVAPEESLAVEATDGPVVAPEHTDPVAGADAFIVWDAVNNRFVAGPFLTSDQAQLHIDFTETKASRAMGYDGPTLCVGHVAFV